MPNSAEQPHDIQTLLDPRVIRELAESIPGFDRAGLLAAIIDNFGGQHALGHAIVQEFQHAKAGSIVRARIIDLICRMISQHSNVTVLRPVEEMDTSEIHSAILSMVPDLQRIGTRKDAGE